MTLRPPPRWVYQSLLLAAIGGLIFANIFVKRDLVNVGLLIGTSAGLWAAFGK